MRIFYNTEEDYEMETIIQNKYYALFDNEWHRVKYLSCNYENETAVVLFIDKGNIAEY